MFIMVACVVTLALLLGGAGQAAAHASLVGSEPADNAVLEQAPQALSLRFNEPVSPLSLKLVTPRGESLPLERYTLKSATLDIAAPEGLGEGTYALSYRVISEDGHPVGGSLIFSIGKPGAAPSALATAAVDYALMTAIWAVRTAIYAGLFLGIGGAFFLAWLAPGARQGSLFCAFALLVALVAAHLSIGLQGLDALAAPLSAINDPAMWKAGFRTSYGTTALVAVASLLLALASLSTRGRSARALTVLALFGVGLALAASGHASAASPQALTRPAVFIHATGVAFWAGALIPLGLMLARRHPMAPTALASFSKAIPYVVALLVAAGLVLSVIQVQRPEALLSTAYGNVLVAKLALIVVLLVLACLNRWRFTMPAQRGEPGATRHLARSIAAETVIIALILGSVALWRFTPPPRSIAAAAAMPAQVHIHTAKAMADLSIAPGRVGPVAASIVIMTGDFGPLDAKEVTLILANPGAGIEPIRRAAESAGDGTWHVEGLTLPVAGRWEARIDILVSDFEKVSLRDAIEIRK